MGKIKDKPELAVGPAKATGQQFSRSAGKLQCCELHPDAMLFSITWLSCGVQ